MSNLQEICKGGVPIENVVCISSEGGKWLSELLNNPPEPTQHLVEAMQRHKESNCE